MEHLLTISIVLGLFHSALYLVKWVRDERLKYIIILLSKLPILVALDVWWRGISNAWPVVMNYLENHGRYDEMWSATPTYFMFVVVGKSLFIP